MDSIQKNSPSSQWAVQKIQSESPANNAVSSAVSTVVDQGEVRSGVSALARQLAAAAERAALRDSQLSRQELAKLGSRIQMELGGRGYTSTKLLHDAFVPSTDDPELLDRAKRATHFLNGSGENPFKGLSTEQLALIGYDEGDDFTHNERLAASTELSHRYALWTHYIVDKANSEYDNTGYRDDALREMIQYYKGLPPIMEAGFGNYEIDLTLLIGQTDQRQSSEDDPLIEMILKTVRKLEDEAEKAHPPIDPSIKPGGLA